MRGEYRLSEDGLVEGDGPPPHAWGILLQPMKSGMKLRSTPTCVGNTAGAGAGRGGLSVHPHMRGEYGRPGRQMATGQGPPPHAWGIRPQGVDIDHRCRSTPTCVGNTSAGWHISRGPSVHPHMRGEYVSTSTRSSRACGPPPHAWGIRGGRVRVVSHGIRADGPPPHAWGILNGGVLHPVGARSTPTCVGNTRRWEDELALSPVHPHMRGEYIGEAVLPMLDSGPPPHAWGIRYGLQPCKRG